jgi:hypothetical protein
VLSIPRVYIDRIIGISTNLVITIIFLSWLSVIFVLLGLPSLFEFDTIGFYLTSFSKGAENGILRPSGIYDEPGALTFFICSLVIVRSFAGYADYKNLLLLIGGLVTQSIVQIMFIPFYLIWLFKKKEVQILKKQLNFLMFLLFAILVFFVFWRLSILDWAINRFILFIDEPLLNPRYRGFMILFDQFSDNPLSLFFGYDVNCINRNFLCEFDILGENPLTPLIYGGLAVSWPYYLFLLISPLVLFRFLPLVLGLCLILLQRPYFLEFSYSATIAFIILVGIIYKNNEKKF